MSDREMRRENYPGQYSTPEDGLCPVCRGLIDVDLVRVDEVRFVEGRWSCPRGCDPRTLMRKIGDVP